MSEYSVINGFVYAEDIEKDNSGFWDMKSKIDHLYYLRSQPDVYKSFGYKADVLRTAVKYLRTYKTTFTGSFVSKRKTERNNIECVLDIFRWARNLPGKKLSPSGWRTLLGTKVESVELYPDYIQKQQYHDLEIEWYAKHPDALISVWCNNSDNAIDEIITFLYLISGEYS